MQKESYQNVAVFHIGMGGKVGSHPNRMHVTQRSQHISKHAHHRAASRLHGFPPLRDAATSAVLELQVKDDGLVELKFADPGGSDDVWMMQLLQCRNFPLELLTASKIALEDDLASIKGRTKELLRGVSATASPPPLAKRSLVSM